MAENPIVIDVGGIPAPQGSMRAILRGGKPRVVPGGSNSGRKALDDWRNRVTDCARHWLAANPQPPLDEPLQIELRFFMPTVASDRYRVRHATFPDKDKLTRGVFDALTASKLVIDDSRFFDIRVVAFYAQEGYDTGCRITIWPRGEEEKQDRETRKALVKGASLF